MDESAFRSARDAMAPQPCAFRNAMLAGVCGRALAARRNIAGRVARACAAPAVAAAERPSLAGVHRLVRACAQKFGGFADLPYSVIVQSVVAFQIRRRRPGR